MRQRKGVLRTRVGTVNVRLSRIEGGGVPPSLVTVIDELEAHVDWINHPLVPVLTLHSALLTAESVDIGRMLNTN